jgi:hypothetical protein
MATPTGYRPFEQGPKPGAILRECCAGITRKTNAKFQFDLSTRTLDRGATKTLDFQFLGISFTRSYGADVVVIDKQRQSVPGLRKNDFQAGSVPMAFLYSRTTEPNMLLWVGAIMGLFVNGVNRAIFALMSET